jgi:hypothetical protein
MTAIKPQEEMARDLRAVVDTLKSLGYETVMVAVAPPGGETFRVEWGGPGASAYGLHRLVGYSRPRGEPVRQP